MKNAGLILLLTIFMGCEKPTVSKVVSAYPDGRTKTELIMSADEKEKYEQISYFDNGAVAIRGKFKDNKRHGKWESFFMNGKLKSVNHYKLGEYDGDYLVYNKDGQLILKGQYKDGLQYGKWLIYDKTGNVDYVRTFDENGKEIKQ